MKKKLEGCRGCAQFHRVLIALAAHWRSDGEYWSGTPADARSQHCADELLQVLGLKPEDHIKAGKEDHEALKQLGVPDCEPPDRHENWSSYFKFHKKEMHRIVKDAENELDKKGGYKKELMNRPRDIIIGEKVMWGFEFGYSAGRMEGTASAKKTHKRGK